jgi:hypothetical protein
VKSIIEGSPNGTCWNYSYSLLAFGVDLFRLPVDITPISPSYYSLDDRHVRNATFENAILIHKVATLACG